mgnify:CR=1 FL=1
MIHMIHTIHTHERMQQSKEREREDASPSLARMPSHSRASRFVKVACAAPRSVGNPTSRGREEEEEEPTMLVFEDLVAAGFEVRSYKDAISVEDAAAVSSALADLHAAFWTIRERLSSNKTEDMRKTGRTNISCMGRGYTRRICGKY